MDEENKEQKAEEVKSASEIEKDTTKTQENKDIESIQSKENTAETKKSEDKTSEQETKKYETFKPIQEEKTKKKSKKGMLISLLVLIIVVIGLCAYYYFEICKDAKTIYQEAIKNGMKSLTATTEEITKMQAKVKLGLDIELEEEIKEEADEYIDEILELINNTEIGLEFQMDKEQQKLLYKIDSTYDNEELIKMNMLLDAKKEDLYMELEQFFDKVLKVQMTDTEGLEALKEAFETDKITLAESITQEKALKIINKELAKSIKEEYCSHEKEKIDIDSKETKVDVYILEMTGEELITEISTIAENLKNNKEFTKWFIDEDEIKEELELIKEELEDIDLEDTQFTLKLYKKGLKQDLVRFDISVSGEDTSVELQITKQQEGYKFKLLQSGITLISGTVKQEKEDENKTKLDIDIKINQVGRIGIKIESSYTTGEDIDQMDIENAIDAEDLTEQDLTEAYKRMQESKLYELVEKYVRLFTGNSLENILNNDKQSNSIESNKNNIESSTSKTTSENQVKTYSGATTITFNIPEGYKSDFATDTSKNFSKGNIMVGVSSYYSNKDTYLNSIVGSYVETFENSGYYKNIQKSTEKTMTVGGRTFYYVELSYEYYNETYKNIFICTPVNDKEVYTVQVSGLGEINQLEVEMFLNIQF